MKMHWQSHIKKHKNIHWNWILDGHLLFYLYLEDWNNFLNYALILFTISMSGNRLKNRSQSTRIEWVIWYKSWKDNNKPYANLFLLLKQRRLLKRGYLPKILNMLIILNNLCKHKRYQIGLSDSNNEH